MLEGTRPSLVNHQTKANNVPMKMDRPTQELLHPVQNKIHVVGTSQFHDMSGMGGLVC